MKKALLALALFAFIATPVVFAEDSAPTAPATTEGGDVTAPPMDTATTTTETTTKTEKKAKKGKRAKKKTSKKVESTSETTTTEPQE